MKSYFFSNTNTCGLTLGLHVCLRIAEMEITNYLSKNFIIILSIINVYYHYMLRLLLYIIYTLFYYLLFYYPFFSENQTFSNGYGSDHNIVLQAYIMEMEIMEILDVSSKIQSKYFYTSENSANFVLKITTYDCGAQQHKIIQNLRWKMWNRHPKFTCKPFYQ